MRYRRRPVKVDAERVEALVRWVRTGDTTGVPEWFREALARGSAIIQTTGISTQARTREGQVFGGPDDWIVRGPDGDVYAMRADAFAMTYKPSTN
jgi:sarcosine oxidase gamma subunit